MINGRSGKIVHEVTPDGAVYFGANADAGNTDESSKYPSAVALVWRWTGDDAFLRDLYPASVRAMKYVASLDEDGDGWPEGLGNVEREGMGEEKLDNTVYTIRGYADLADMARARGDRADRDVGRPAGPRAMLRKFEDAWWYDAGRRELLRRLPRRPGQREGLPAALDRAHPDRRRAAGRARQPQAGPAGVPRATRNTTLDQHERSCYTDELGLFHTGTGPTSAPAGNPGASCDTVVSEVPSERSIFTLNSAIAAVSEGNYGRLGSGPAGHLHVRQRPQPARPDAVGDARRDARDRPRRRLRRQHRPAVHRAVDGDAGLGLVRHPVAGRAPVARRLARTSAAARSPWCRRCRPGRPRSPGAGSGSVTAASPCTPSTTASATSPRWPAAAPSASPSARCCRAAHPGRHGPPQRPRRHAARRADRPWHGGPRTALAAGQRDARLVVHLR